MAIEFTVRFDGLAADDHQLDMRLLGRSLIGLDRVISEGLFVAIEGRRPRHLERLPLVIRATPAEAACYEIHGIVGAVAGVLPFAHAILSDPGTKFIFNLLSYLLKIKGGKPNEAERNFVETVEALKEIHLAELEDRRDERASRLADADAWRAHVLDMADRFRLPLNDIVSPLGNAAETLTLPGPEGAERTVIDVPMAEAIRSRENLSVSELETMRLKVDGIILHSRSLKVELPEEPGRFMTADVRDPAFEAAENPYLAAVDRSITVQAKVSRRPNGEVAKLYIMNVVSEAS